MDFNKIINYNKKVPLNNIIDIYNYIYNNK